MEDAERKRYQEKYGLSYHVDDLLAGDRMVGLRGKRVLEIGGTLPGELVLEGVGAEQWISFEDMSYYAEIDNWPEDRIRTPLEQLSSVAELPRHAICDGKVEAIPASFHGQFDAVFSMACFEHLPNLPVALKNMHDCLKPGGKVFSLFSPIWSAHDGHHMHGVTDKAGRFFNWSKSPVPPWGHLLMSPSEMYVFLLDHTDEEAACKMVYNIYHSPIINRLFVEDYLTYIDRSPFAGHAQISKAYLVDVPVETAEQLARRYPRNGNFDANGLLMILEKAA